MAFDKKTWANNQAGGTPLDASGLNDLESRIEDEFGYMDSKIDGIIQRGSTINGTWIKFSDGTMIIKHTAEISGATSPYGALFSSPFYDWDLPQNFVDIPKYGGTVRLSKGGNAFSVARLTFGGTFTGSKIGAIFMICVAADATFEGEMDLIAIGRWK